MLTVLKLEFPPSISPGDLVAVVAPSGPPPGDELWRGLAWLRARYRIRMGPGVLARAGYLAGDDDRRAAELAEALRDGDVRAIVAARGGYGALRLLDRVPWAALSARPKWIVGFSDATVLHGMAWRAGVASVHGPNVTDLGGRASVAGRAAWLAALERPSGENVWRSLRVLHSGQATGALVGGNLTLIHSLAVAARLSLPEGAVLALEDVSEAPYRIDRMLTGLLLGGHLARVSAIVFGGFDRSVPGPDGATSEEVLEERTRRLGIPVLAGAPFGHGDRNLAFVLGAVVRVSGDQVLWPAGVEATRSARARRSEGGA